MGTGFYDQCTQGKFTIIKDCVKIADNTTIPPNTVVPTLACFGGSPGQITPRQPPFVTSLTSL